MSAAVPPVTVISGCAIATVDPQGTEYQTGHLVMEGSRIVEVGAGPADPSWRERGGGLDRRAGHAGHTRAGQYPSPPLPVDHPGLRPGRDAVRLADLAVPGLGRDRRGDGGGIGVGQPGLDGAVRHHADHRPPLRLPEERRRRAGRDHRRRADHRPPVPSHPGLDGSGHGIGWPAARVGGGEHRCRAWQRPRRHWPAGTTRHRIPCCRSLSHPVRRSR